LPNTRPVWSLAVPRSGELRRRQASATSCLHWRGTYIQLHKAKCRYEKLVLWRGRVTKLKTCWMCWMCWSCWRCGEEEIQNPAKGWDRQATCNLPRGQPPQDPLSLSRSDISSNQQITFRHQDRTILIVTPSISHPRCPAPAPTPTA